MSAPMLQRSATQRPYDTVRDLSGPNVSSSSQPSRTMTTVRRKAPPKLTPDLFDERPAAADVVSSAAAAAASSSKTPPLRRSISLKALRSRTKLSDEPEPPVPAIPPPLQQQFVLEIDQTAQDSKSEQEPEDILKLIGADAVPKRKATTKRPHFRWLYGREREEEEAKKLAVPTSVAAAANANSTGTQKTFLGLFKSPASAPPTQETTQFRPPSRTRGLSRKTSARCLDISAPTGVVHLSSGAATVSARGSAKDAAALAASARLSMCTNGPRPSISASERSTSSPILSSNAAFTSSPRLPSIWPPGADDVGNGLRSPPTIPMRSSSYGAGTTAGPSPASNELTAARQREPSSSSEMSSSSSVGSNDFANATPLRPARSIRRPAAGPRPGKPPRINIADCSDRRDFFSPPSLAGGPQQQQTPQRTLREEADDLVTPIAPPTIRIISKDSAVDDTLANRMSGMIADSPLLGASSDGGGAGGAKSPMSSGFFLPSVREFERQLQRTLTSASKHHPSLSRRFLRRGSGESGSALSAAGTAGAQRTHGDAAPHYLSAGSEMDDDGDESSDETKSLSDVEGWECLSSSASRPAPFANNGRAAALAAVV